MTIVYFAFAFVLTAFVALPLVRSPHWTVRVFDYPRIQKLFLVLIMIALWPIAVGSGSTVGYVALVLLIAAACHLVYVVLPNTPLGRKMVRRVVPRTNEKPLSMLVCNVLQTNRDHERMGRLITTRQPEVVVLLETDAQWRSGIQPFVQDYPHRVEVPLDNTYGILLYTRLPIVRHNVEHLVDPEVPSITADLEYRGELATIKTKTGETA